MHNDKLFQQYVKYSWYSDFYVNNLFIKFWFGHSKLYHVRSWPKVLRTPNKMCKIRNLWKTPRVSLLPFLYDTVLVTALPPHPPSNVESPCNDSGCEGRFESTLHGVGGEMRGFERFLQKCPKSFGQDCSSCMSLKSWGTNLLISYAS